MPLRMARRGTHELLRVALELRHVVEQQHRELRGHAEPRPLANRASRRPVDPRVRRSGRMRIRKGTRGADRGLSHRPDSSLRVDYGPIVISEMRSLAVRVLRNGQPVPQADVVVGRPNEFRPRAASLAARTDATGIARFEGLVERKVGVYAVAPGFVETDLVADILSGPQGAAIRQQSPLGRVARPEEVARTVLFLASEGSEFLTGCIVDVNGASYLRS